MLSELLQPQRYPGSLLGPAGQHAGGQADGAARAGQDADGRVSDPAGLECLQPDEVGAARQVRGWAMGAGRGRSQHWPTTESPTGMGVVLWTVAPSATHVIA